MIPIILLLHPHLGEPELNGNILVFAGFDLG
jgi:hypothetical protein